MAQPKVKTWSRFYWMQASWGTRFIVDERAPFGYAWVAADNWTCVVVVSMDTATAMDQAEDAILYATLSDLSGESELLRQVSLGLTPESADRPASVTLEVEAFLRAELKRSREQVKNDYGSDRSPNSDGRFPTPYIWAREIWDPTAGWLRELNHHTTQSILSAESSEIKVSRSGRVRAIKHATNVLGFPVELILGRFYQESQALRIYSYELRDVVIAAVIEADISAFDVYMVDTTRGTQDIFGWDVWDVLARELWRSARTFPRDELMGALPNEIVDTMQEAWEVFEGLDLPVEVLQAVGQVTAYQDDELDDEVDGAERECDFCGRLWREWEGDAFLCDQCDRDATVGLPVGHDRDWEPSMLWAILELSRLLGGGVFAVRDIISDMERPSRRRIALAMLAQQGSYTWPQRMLKSGIAGDAYRPSRGILSVAEDGHMCRSHLERVIDDWMWRNGVKHSIEPHYPRDAELNPNARLRADWILVDGSFVEAFGALQDEAYSARADVKRRLAKKAGLTLIEILPSDVGRLRSILGDWTGRE